MVDSSERLGEFMRVRQRSLDQINVSPSVIPAFGHVDDAAAVQLKSFEQILLSDFPALVKRGVNAEHLQGLPQGSTAEGAVMRSIADCGRVRDLGRPGVEGLALDDGHDDLYGFATTLG